MERLKRVGEPSLPGKALSTMKFWVLLLPSFVLLFAGCEPYGPAAAAAPSSNEASLTATNTAVTSQDTTEQPRRTGADSPHDAGDGSLSASASHTTESQPK